MTLKPPPKPARFGALVNETVSIREYGPSTTTGGIGTNSFEGTVASMQPCVFQVMSTSESQKYGSITDDTLYEVFLPTVATDGTNIQAVGPDTSWVFVTSDGTRYSAIGAGVLVGDGMQRIPLRRLTGESA